MLSASIAMVADALSFDLVEGSAFWREWAAPRGANFRSRMSRSKSKSTHFANIVSQFRVFRDCQLLKVVGEIPKKRAKSASLSKE